MSKVYQLFRKYSNETPELLGTFASKVPAEIALNVCKHRNRMKMNYVLRQYDFGPASEWESNTEFYISEVTPSVDIHDVIKKEITLGEFKKQMHSHNHTSNK